MLHLWPGYFAASLTTHTVLTRLYVAECPPTDRRQIEGPAVECSGERDDKASTPTPIFFGCPSINATDVSPAKTSSF